MASLIKSRFTDKAAVFDGLSVSKTHFTDKQVFSKSSPNLCVNYFFSRALVVQGMPLHPCLRTSTLSRAVKGAPLRTSKRFP